MSRDYQGPDYSLEDLRSVIDAMCKSLESSGLIDEHEHPSAYSALLDTSKWMAEMEGQTDNLLSACHRLALELECLLLDTKDSASVSRWWDSAMAALDEWHKVKDSVSARPVPAEPVNVRLLEAMKRAKSALVSFKFVPEHANCWEESDEEDLAAIDGAIAAAEAQQDRLLQDMHDAGREIDRVMAEPAPKAARLTDEEIASLLAASDKNSPRVPSFFMTEPHKFARAIETAAIRKNGLALED